MDLLRGDPEEVRTAKNMTERVSAIASERFLSPTKGSTMQVVVPWVSLLVFVLFVVLARFWILQSADSV